MGYIGRYCSSVYGRDTGDVCGGVGGELVPTLFIGQAKACVAEKKKFLEWAHPF